MKIKKIIRYITITCLSLVFIFSGVMLIKSAYENNKAVKEFENLAQIVTSQSEEAESTPTSSSEDNTQSDTESTTKNPALVRNISALKEINDECVGWISIPHTVVNYPVMLTPDNPEKYLNKNFYEKYNPSGVPFIDARCNLESKNIIIYGHNMKNRSMFGSLRNYLKNDYLKAHPVIEFETVDGCSYYEIIEVKKTNIKDEWYSLSPTLLAEGKEYLTLSTCYGTNKADRLLIIATKK